LKEKYILIGLDKGTPLQDSKTIVEYFEGQKIAVFLPDLVIGSNKLLLKVYFCIRNIFGLSEISNRSRNRLSGIRLG